MIGLGTIVNAAAIIAGGSAGSILRNGLPERFRTTVMQAIGLSVVVIGLSGSLEGIFSVNSGGKLESGYIMTMIFSLVLGSLAGEAMNIEQKLEQMGNWFQNRFAKGSSNFAEGFVNASLVYCVGAMAIVGALEDGFSGDTATLFAKSILDGVSAIVFAATMGIGVAFSALSILLYQGSITLLAGVIKPWMGPELISQVSLVGSVLIMAIGFNMLEIKRIKVGNLLPAMFMPIVFYGLDVIRSILF